MEVLNKISSEQKINPKVVAAITAALAAGGYLSAGARVAGIKKLNRQMNPWKRSGVVAMMMDRDFSLR